MKNEMIKELRLGFNNEMSNLFNKEDHYIIPLYQRAYSWGDKEINQLIDDINDFESEIYYLGSLIVSKNENGYEIIDGQQRLTTLYILFKVLNYETCGSLSFQCRDKSNYALKNLLNFDLRDEKIESEINKGYEIIKERINKDVNRKEFIKKLNRVVIYRIEVPPHTDLNRYFEIMNTRGEQLEQHDVLKASLMNNLSDTNERKAFATIWEACSNMNGYVAMHFNKSNREKLFETSWNNLIDDPFKKLTEDPSTSNDELDFTILNIINLKSAPKMIDSTDDEDTKVRFESIINFDYFLEHTLKVLIKVNKYHDNLENTLLDDKKLLDFFNIAINTEDKDNLINKHDFSVNFINCLLKCRFLFDNYILKREFTSINEDGAWSIKTLSAYSRYNQKIPYYLETNFKDNDSLSNKRSVMIQSCLRVSYTSPKIMHWITKGLIYLYSTNKYADFNYFLENIARESIKNSCFENDKISEQSRYYMGVNTPHILFNYLDYLIWKNNPNKYKDFNLEFRNSVEHWYPQHPSIDSFKPMKDVDRLGNLCIISRNINSKFSNMSPVSKKNTFKETIDKGSLKLRLMAYKTIKDEEWITNDCKEHETYIIDLLENDINKLNE